MTETRAAGGRVVAVGTTVVRALESAPRTGRTEGWTDLVVTPATHLRQWTACSPAGTRRRRRTCCCSRPSPTRTCWRASYRAALGGGYLWHEFGDVHLILP